MMIGMGLFWVAVIAGLGRRLPRRRAVLTGAGLPRNDQNLTSDAEGSQR